MTKTIDVFLSHAYEDLEIARQFVSGLEAAQVSCWLADRDGVPGKSWAGSIVSAILDSLALAVLLTTYSIQSEHVLREVTVAVDEHVQLIPVRLENAPLSNDLRYYFSMIQYLDVTVTPLPEAIAQLVSSIKRLKSEGSYLGPGDESTTAGGSTEMPFYGSEVPLL